MKADFLPKLIARYRMDYDAKLSVNWEGEAAQNIESIDSMMKGFIVAMLAMYIFCLLYTSPSPRDGLLSRMPSSA